MTHVTHEMYECNMYVCTYAQRLSHVCCGQYLDAKGRQEQYTGVNLMGRMFIIYTRSNINTYTNIIVWDIVAYGD